MSVGERNTWGTLETPETQISKEHWVHLLPSPQFLSHVVAQVRGFPQLWSSPSVEWEVWTRSRALLSWCSPSSCPVTDNGPKVDLQEEPNPSLHQPASKGSTWNWTGLGAFVTYPHHLLNLMLLIPPESPSGNHLMVSLVISLLDRNKGKGNASVSLTSQFCSFSSLSHFWKHHIWALVV